MAKSKYVRKAVQLPDFGGVELNRHGYPAVHTLPVGGDGYPVAPEGVRVFAANGVGYGLQAKKIVYGPGTFGPNTTAMTTETGRVNQALGVRVRMDKLKTGIDDALVTYSHNGTIAAGLQHMAEDLLDTARKGGRDGVTATRLVWQAGGYMMQHGAKAGEAGDDGVRIPSPEHLDKLLDVLDSMERLKGAEGNE